MRAEIRATRAAMAARGDENFTMEDLDSMTCVMNANKVRPIPPDAVHHLRADVYLFLQETLRFHPIVFILQRVAVKDDVLPLSEPITLKSGEVVDAIPVKAGQWINISLCAYNR